MTSHQMRQFLSWLPTKLTSNTDLSKLMEDLQNEVIRDYQHSMKKAIVDYILMDTGERKRLRIAAIPHSFPRRYVCELSATTILCCCCRTIRAPLPWHDRFQQVREEQTIQLFITNLVMSKLQNLWDSK